MYYTCVSISIVSDPVKNGLRRLNRAVLRMRNYAKGGVRRKITPPSPLDGRYSTQFGDRPLTRVLRK
jgi:hypothetical protein